VVISKAEPASVVVSDETNSGLIHELIEARWSPRSFSGEAISDDQLKSILNAASWASSSYNEQPWRFVVARKQDASFKDMLEILNPGNRTWASQASVLILMAAKKSLSRNGATNHFALHDTGSALANLLLQATALGLHGHAMGGYDRAKAREVFGIPEDFDLASVVALGFYRGPGSAAAANRTRKPLNEIAFSGRWDKPLQF
jgi:nitroreductase